MGQQSQQQPVVLCAATGAASKTPGMISMMVVIAWYLLSARSWDEISCLMLARENGASGLLRRERDHEGDDGFVHTAVRRWDIDATVELTL